MSPDNEDSQDNQAVEAAERRNARDALSVPEFRRLYIGTTISNA